MSNYYLEHYGVVGMKWGRRKVRSLGAPVIELGPDEYRDAGSNSRRTGGKSNSNSSSKQSSSNSNAGSAGGTGKSKKEKSNTKSNANTNQTSTSESTASKKLDVKSAQTSLKEGKKLVDAGAKYLDDDRKKQTQRDLKNEAKNMSDDELRTVINRLSMEERYVQAMGKEGVGKSKTDLQKTLELVGTAVSYADTALEVYDKIQAIRGR